MGLSEMPYQYAFASGRASSVAGEAGAHEPDPARVLPERGP